MRIVLDTNVLVSGLLNPHGSPGRIVDIVLTGELVLLVDDRIISEYRDVLLRPRFNFSPADVRALISFIEHTAEYVTASPLAIELKDPADKPFLEVAVAGLADRLITGNARHFLPYAEGLRVEVATPAELIRETSTDR